MLDTYAYDQNGNRTSRNEGGAVTTYTANALNEYSAVSGASIAHSDDRGNITQWQGWSYTYDAENRLVSATASGQSFAFAYDAQGRLAKLTENGMAEYRYFDGAQLFLRKQQSNWRRKPKLGALQRNTPGSKRTCPVLALRPPRRNPNWNRAKRPFRSAKK